MQSFQRAFLVATALATGAVIAGCNGGSSTTVPPVAVATAPVILVAGSTRTFSGSDSQMHVYASPSAGQSNFTAASTFSGTTTISKAAPGAPAAWDVNQTVHYTVTQAAKAGTQALTADTDTFDNQTMTGKTTTIAQVASQETAMANDVSAGLAGGGPYTLTTTSSTSNVVPVTTVFPLQTGLTTTEPLSRTAKETQTDRNAGGAPPPAPFVFITAQAATYANDGSFSVNPRTYSNGDNRLLTESANGTAKQTDTTSPFAETVGLATLSGPSYVIPVSITTTGGVTTSYNAADWYPGGALAPAPLELRTVTIKGPASSLPAACSGAMTLPNLVEIDTNQTTLNVFGSYSTEAQQAFNANGISDCLIRNTITKSYDLKTGTLTETETDAYTQVLKSVTSASSSTRKSAPIAPKG
jgi:hypothetical protein